MAKILVSVVSGTYNEQDNVEHLYFRVKEVFSKLVDEYDYNQIIIDNNSTDQTREILKNLATKDKKLKLIFNTRNFGHICSPGYAILNAPGDIVIYLASDLQDPPEMILDFIKGWEQGYKVVLGQKTNSKESPMLFFVRKTFYCILNKVNDSGAELLPNCTGFGLYDAKVIKQMREMGDAVPYIRGLVGELGYKIMTIPFTQPNRVRGFSKNNIYTLFDNAMLGFTSHSKVPLRMATFIGFICSGMSFFAAIGYLIAKLIFWKNFTLGIAPLLIGFFFFMSVNLFFLGMVGEYVGAVFTQVRKRPSIIEQERINFEK